MDLEKFDILDEEGSASPSQHPVLSAQDALDQIDRIWYRPANRRARWMDLLGDYAGSEPFVIDGESLLQIVLDDTLLALGRSNEPGFQILHAFQTLERMLIEFKQRSAEISVVFWEANRHTTLQTGGHAFSVASRVLARVLLFKHLQKLDVAVHTFGDLDDPLCLQYEAANKPMFVMVNDGGVSEGSEPFGVARILTQRIFLFDILSRGTAVALLKGAEYRDSKILSFVYEQSRNVNVRAQIPPGLWKVAKRTRASLKSEIKRQSGQEECHLVLNPSLPVEDGSVVIVRIAQAFLDRASFAFATELLYIFIAHLVLVRKISIRERARLQDDLGQELLSIAIDRFLPALFFAAAEVLCSSAASLDVDGRIFSCLVRLFILHRANAVPVLIGPSAHAATQSIWSKVGSPSLDLQHFAASFSLPPVPFSGSLLAPQPFRLLPFENDVFNAELSLVNVPIHDGDDPQISTYLDFGQGTLFSDTQHWHNQKAILPSYLGGAAPKPQDERRRRRELRKNQRFMATLQTQAGTLTGAAGASLQQIIIPPVVSEVSRVPQKSRSPVVKLKNEKAPKLSSADKLRQKIKEEKDSIQEDSSQVWWKGHMKTMSKMTTAQKVFHVKSLARNKKSEEKAMGAEMRIYRLNLEILLWLDEADPESASTRDRYTVSIMRMAKEMCDRRYVTPTISKALMSVLHSLGFEDYAAALLANCENAPDRPIGFEFTKLIKSKTKSPYYPFMHITEHPVIWQLRLFGEFMDRSMDSAPDRRVSFDPDAWQRRVLDCVDADSSLLVVAPTSAGKTFISYYAMEKVLRASDEGILVYVAPTKALVTQIAAEVYARFSKNLNGKSCWAIHTRDYRIHDPQKCQILVTVPEMLAIMLLSPPLARVWTSRIKRIILDEIHSIGQQEGGAVWEQIILLAPCPIIGLSATIGSPEIFNDWLESVQTAHGYKHTFIQYTHRYSHLRKFQYVLDDDSPQNFDGLDSYLPTQRARFLHPISLLSFGPRSIPTDLALESRDILSLYKALLPYRHSLDCDLLALEPTVFFSSNVGILKQKDVVEYEAKLKDVLSKLITSSDPQDLSSPLYGVIHRLKDPVIANMTTEDLNTAPSRELFQDNLIYLLADLHSRGELPAILFNFDRSDCEIMAKVLVSTLEAGERKWRSNSSEWQRKMAKWEDWKLRSKERERLAEKAKKHKKDPDDPESGRTPDSSWESSFDPDDPAKEFSFAGEHTSYTKANLQEDIHELTRWTSQPWALEALKRGIAVHHAGMNKRYRSLVESLFRQGFVRVVIATGTLALGINAPTKTSVFCGDSPFLTALMYRQCAGRAGRRGYDLLGNVVFYGLPLDRVQRLVLSKLPSLGGNFPLTSTLTLRLLNLLEGSNYAPVAVKAVKSIMSLPHVSFNSDAGRHQLLHHLRFSIEFLRRSRLLDKHGRPMNLFAFAAHLYYTEPSNFALVALLRNGVLHHICKQPSSIIARRNYIILMAHLFGRRYISRIYANPSHIAELTKRYPSVVILPPLPKHAREVLVQHDKEILQIFVSYALAYAKEYAKELGSDYFLPLSKIDYSGVDNPNDPDSTSIFRTYLKNSALSVVARSLFVANSGHGDDFKSVQELARTAREGLHLNEHAIPSLGHLVKDNSKGEARELEHVLNAYLLDFYTHGQVSSLAIANGIRRGDVWYLLQDFALTLTTIKTALEQLLLKASKEALSAKSTLSDEEHDEFDSGYGSLDPTDMDHEDIRDEEDSNNQGGTEFQRPRGVRDNDWRVYEIVRGAALEFDEKYKAMWA